MPLSRFHNYSFYSLPTKYIDASVYQVGFSTSKVQIEELCLLDSGAYCLVFNDELWINGTISKPLTLATTKICGISGVVQAYHQTIVGDLPVSFVLILRTMSSHCKGGWYRINLLSLHIVVLY